MDAAAALFAERGYAAVSTSDIGEAVGISGPALYNHFSSKEAILSELLVDVSTRLLAGGLEIAASGSEAHETATTFTRTPKQVIDALIAFHLEFALAEPDVIVLQMRELRSLPPEASHKVRRLQREYMRVWQATLQRFVPGLDDGEAQTRVRATFGLLNSTPNSARASGDRAAEILTKMAHRALIPAR